jgi:phosphoglycolate phosphatase-like HAD superfamily hydrolase
MHLLLDLDDCMFDASWREQLINEGWDTYHSHLKDDKPVPEVLALVRALFFAGWKIHAITARPEKWRQATVRHCVKFSIPIERVLMRADNDKRRAPDVKTDLVLNNFDGISRSHMVALDDREDIALAYKAMGIVTFQVHRLPVHVKA